MRETNKEYRIKDRPRTIYRVVKSSENPYVMIDRRPIDNPELSFKAKGVLTYLMSRPDGWEVSVADLINHATDGEDSVRSGLKELRNAGHMKYTKMREKGRITGWLIEVYELPLADFQHVVKPDEEKPDKENPTQVLLKLNNKELRNKETEVGCERKKEREKISLSYWQKFSGKKPSKALEVIFSEYYLSADEFGCTRGEAITDLHGMIEKTFLNSAESPEHYIAACVNTLTENHKEIHKRTRARNQKHAGVVAAT